MTLSILTEHKKLWKKQIKDLERIQQRDWKYLQGNEVTKALAKEHSNSLGFPYKESYEETLELLNIRMMDMYCSVEHLAIQILPKQVPSLLYHIKEISQNSH